MKHTTLILLLLAGSVSQADTILGIYAGASHWQHDLADERNGDLAEQTSSETGNVFYLALEHPVPFVPNIKLQRNDIEGTARGELLGIGVDGGITRVDALSRIDLSHTELMLYYEILDNWVNLDLGLALKQFNGTSALRLDGFSDVVNDLDDLVPMLYGKGQIDLPFTGFSVYGSVQALSLGDDEVSDLELGLNYESSIGLGAVVGYRSLNTDWERRGNVNLDLQAEGFFVGLNYHF
jgi:outer membrane protein